MLYLLPELRYTAYFLREAKDYVMKNYDPATPYEGEYISEFLLTPS